MTNAVSLAQQASTGVSQGFKNRLINGAMVISQRGTSFSFVNGDANVYTLDRWRSDDMVDANFTISQSSDAPAGFINSLLVTTTSGDASIGSSQYSVVQQQIEANNINDLNWGTANAKAVTLSFWVKSSLTGTFGGSIRDNAATYSFPFSYTISSANTWTQASVTISGPTSGSFSGTNGLAATVFFSLGVGSGLSAAAGSWTASNILSSTASAGFGVTGTTNATWYITGVQLEVGSTATSFDYRPYGTELALCQRYFWQCTDTVGVVINTNNISRTPVNMPVPMRAAPTLVSGASFAVSSGSAGTPLIAIGTGYPATVTAVWIYNSSNNWSLAQAVQLTGGFTAEL